MSEKITSFLLNQVLGMDIIYSIYIGRTHVLQVKEKTEIYVPISNRKKQPVAKK